MVDCLSDKKESLQKVYTISTSQGVNFSPLVQENPPPFVTHVASFIVEATSPTTRADQLAPITAIITIEDQTRSSFAPTKRDWDQDQSTTFKEDSPKWSRLSKDNASGSTTPLLIVLAIIHAWIPHTLENVVASMSEEDLTYLQKFLRRIR
ncbi:unnamed protein product [Vicia faba]|uniref:Uncharacterized protein n=1 Tax=Vicia faba TaxID=3906 RepID=A0AAV0Z886_VICFA|nr:unnamed protein product [Vicia faba]